LTPEGKVKKEVIAYLNERGAYFFMPVTGGYGRSGVPDIVACLNGKFVGIECKAGDNQPTALQVKNLKAIRSAGGLSFCVNSVKLLREQLESELERLE
jgi:Holliday junction resolvase